MEAPLGGNPLEATRFDSSTRLDLKGSVDYFLGIGSLLEVGSNEILILTLDGAIVNFGICFSLGGIRKSYSHFLGFRSSVPEGG